MTVDGLSRLSSLRDGKAQTTSYTYDTLGHVTQITQGAQTRTFSYDALGRMLSETHPESGTTTYTYDTDSVCSYTSKGDLIRKSDANGNNLCHFYDPLHRLTDIGNWSTPLTPWTGPCKRFRY